MLIDFGKWKDIKERLEESEPFVVAGQEENFARIKNNILHDGFVQKKQEQKQ